MEWKRYLLASIIGFAPLSFLLAYLGEINYKMQLALVLSGLLLILGIALLIYDDKKVRLKLIDEWNKEFE